MQPDTDPENAPQHLSWSGMTHVGRVRKNNEDAFLALTYNDREVRYLGKIGESSFAQGDFVFAVSDGMGGANAGEFASKIAVERITRLMPRVYRLAAQHLAGGVSDALEEIFHHVHAELGRLGQAYQECAGMGATLSLAVFSPGWMHFAHVGDSRIYYLPRGGAMLQATQDHSYVGWLRRQGKLNEREARSHPGKNVLNQALGAGHQILMPHFGSVSCHPGDRFLLCTDGITDALWDSKVELLGREQPVLTAAAHIVETAVAEAGRDNCTAVLVEFAE